MKLVQLIGNRAVSTATVEEIEAIANDGEIAERIEEAMRNSMGQ